MMKIDNSVAGIERRIFYYLGAMCLFITMWRPGSTIFFGLAIFAGIHRLLVERSDIRERAQKVRPLLLASAVLLIPSLVSAALGDDPVRGLRFWVKLVLFYNIACLLVLFFVRERRRLLTLLGLIGVAITVNGVVAIGQFAMVPFVGCRNSGFLHYMVQGTLTSVWIGLLFLLRPRLTGLYRRLGDVSLAVSVAALLINGTRGTYISTGVLVLVLAIWLVKNRRTLARGLACVAIVLALLTAASGQFVDRLESSARITDQSQNERLLVWTGALNMFADHPVLGVGYGNFGPVYLRDYISPVAKEQLGHAHNNLLQVLAEQGVVGAAAMVFVWLYLTVMAYRRYRATGSRYALIIPVVLWGIMLHGMTEYTFWSSTTLRYMWLLLGLGYALSELEE